MSKETAVQRRRRKDYELMLALTKAADAYNEAFEAVITREGLSVSYSHFVRLPTGREWAVYRTFKTGKIEDVNTYAPEKDNAILS